MGPKKQKTKHRTKIWKYNHHTIQSTGIKHIMYIYRYSSIVSVGPLRRLCLSQLLDTKAVFTLENVCTLGFGLCSWECRSHIMTAEGDSVVEHRTWCWWGSMQRSPVFFVYSSSAPHHWMLSQLIFPGGHLPLYLLHIRYLFSTLRYLNYVFQKRHQPTHSLAVNLLGNSHTGSLYFWLGGWARERRENVHSNWLRQLRSHKQPFQKSLYITHNKRWGHC